MSASPQPRDPADRDAPDRRVREIEILEDVSEFRGPKEGFLKLSRLLLRNRYADGTVSEPYDCDIVSRAHVDAVTIVLFQRGPNGDVRVGLRENLRAPVFLRRHKDRILWPEDPPFTTLIETVAGVLEPDGEAEDLDTALDRRAAEECLEEVGISVKPGNILPLGGASFPTPGIGDEKVHFRAVEVDLSKAVPPTGDGSVMEEVGGLVVLDLVHALQACREGRIADMKTEIALCRLRDLLI
ncbi:MAG: NUDIX hydrolase [Planctomycetota bacterium]